MSEPNRLLRVARERTPSCRVPGAYMSRAELAEAVALWAAEHDGKRRGVGSDVQRIGEPQPTETSRVEWISLASVPQLMAAGQVPDGPSLTALAFYQATIR
ncbi:MAG: hypothetical protein ACRDS1_01030 [Pseudonocardiaceae bacterium]